MTQRSLLERVVVHYDVLKRVTTPLNGRPRRTPEETVLTIAESPKHIIRENVIKLEHIIWRQPVLLQHKYIWSIFLINSSTVENP